VYTGWSAIVAGGQEILNIGGKIRSGYFG